MSTTVRIDSPPRALSAIAILEGIAALFTFVQFATAGEFIRTQGDAGEAWQNVHGVTAYGVLVPSLAAAVLAVVALRDSARVLTVLTVVLFVAAVGQWGTGHLISTLGMDGWTPFHVFFSSVVLALVVWVSVRASVRASVLRRRA